VAAGAAPEPPAPASYAECPFPGLEVFGEGDAKFFFGRHAEVVELLRYLGPGLDGLYRRWLQVEGPSGVGKSSLVRAGLIPSVRQGWLEEQRRPGEWLVLDMRPGRDPVEALAATLERALARPGAPATLKSHLDELRRPDAVDPGALRYLLKVALPDHTRLLLLLDQLEEVFTLTRTPASRERLDALLAVALDDADCPLYLVTTIRSDFMMRFPELPRLQGLLDDRVKRYFLKPMGEAALREVVGPPAQLARLRWSEKGLPGRIVEDALPAGDGALPLVANLLRLLWDRSEKRRDGVLSADDYRDLGGVGGALAKSADRLLASLGPDGRQRARKLLLALVTRSLDSEPTRRTITREMALREAGGPQRRSSLASREDARPTAARRRGSSPSGPLTPKARPWSTWPTRHCSAPTPRASRTGRP
jgi:eukaryotic-like serine/threonine-protein kinase